MCMLGRRRSFAGAEVEAVGLGEVEANEVMGMGEVEANEVMGMGMSKRKM